MKPPPRPLGLRTRSPYVCAHCVQRLQVRFPSTIIRRAARQGFRYKYGEKLEAAEEQWQEQAARIRQGNQPSMLCILEGRGYVQAITEDRDKLDELMTSRRIGAYVGVDPTADSLHVGHLVPLMALLWLYIHGYQAVTLLGGATAQFGDPTGRTKQRSEVTPAVRKQRVALMQMQLKKLWMNMHDLATKRYGYTRDWAWKRALLNNNAWLNKLSTVDFLRLAGKPQRVNDMMRRSTASTKLNSSEGLSFAELAYPLLQGWDWFHLFEKLGVQMQIGGADQFGNITAGMEIVDEIVPEKIDQSNWPERFGPDARRVGLTTPLLTSAAGEKFGKTEGNAVWLNPDMTSTSDLYNFFMRTADADVERYLKLFTLIPLSQIATLMGEQTGDASKRPAQRRLAHEVVALIYGLPEAEKIAFEQGLLFRAPSPAASAAARPVATPNAHDINAATNPNAPQVNAATTLSYKAQLPARVVREMPMSRVLYAAGMVASRAEGQRLVTAGGAYVGGQKGKALGMGDALTFVPITDGSPGAAWPYVVDGQTLFLRVGKWKVKVVRLVSDKEWERQGLTAPGVEEAQDSGEQAGSEMSRDRAGAERPPAQRGKREFMTDERRDSVPRPSTKVEAATDLPKLRLPVVYKQQPLSPYAEPWEISVSNGQRPMRARATVARGGSSTFTKDHRPLHKGSVPMWQQKLDNRRKREARAKLRPPKPRDD